MDVCKGLKDIRRVLPALALGACVSLGAQTTGTAGTVGQDAAPALHLPPNPPTVTKFFPLSEIRRGQQGVAYTVFEGTKPEPMGVEILGVLRNAIGPRMDMILARLEGQKADYTGVVAGMSGSPVYIDGRLVGALAYRIGQFSKEPIAGITPISEMLGVTEQSEAPGTEIAEAAAMQPAAAGV
ncbi:MAG: SpoIVB peptidase S55 domain-containing protein [Acidobacteriaceae bacterium]